MRGSLALLLGLVLIGCGGTGPPQAPAPASLVYTQEDRVIVRGYYRTPTKAVVEKAFEACRKYDRVPRMIDVEGTALMKTYTFGCVPLGS